MLGSKLNVLCKASWFTDDLEVKACRGHRSWRQRPITLAEALILNPRPHK